MFCPFEGARISQINSIMMQKLTRLSWYCINFVNFLYLYDTNDLLLNHNVDEIMECMSQVINNDYQSQGNRLCQYDISFPYLSCVLPLSYHCLVSAGSVKTDTMSVELAEQQILVISCPK
jgi:hypothetical protein